MSRSEVLKKYRSKHAVQLKAYRKKYNMENKEKIAVHKRKVRQTNLDECRTIEKEKAKRRYSQNADFRYSHYKNGAAERELCWNLTKEDFMKLVQSKDGCMYCGHIPEGKTLLGIDRVDNTKGYTVENCMPCCAICNIGKGTKTAYEFVQMCKNVAKYWTSE